MKMKFMRWTCSGRGFEKSKKAYVICSREEVNCLGGDALTPVHSRTSCWLFTVASGVEGSEGV